MFDAETLVLEGLSSERNVLALIALTIIRAHPQKKRKGSTDTRLDTALSSLLGERRRTGRPTNDDEALLRDIAEEYFLRLANGTGEPAIAPIIRRALDHLPSAHPLRKDREDWDDHDVRVIRKKFLQVRDLYLAQLTTSSSRAIKNRIEKLRTVLELLTDLGITVDRSALDRWTRGIKLPR